MFFSIRKKLILIYILLVLIPLILVNYWAVNNMRNTVLGEIEVNTLKTANIIANLSKESIGDIAALKRIIRQYELPMGGRTLILSRYQFVLADSHSLLEGKNIYNEEISSALRGKEKLGYYHKDGSNEKRGSILQVAVPIHRSIKDVRRVEGIVLISTSVASVLHQVEDFQRQLMYISIAAALVGFVVAVMASGSLAKPIVILSKAAKRIEEGHLGETVSIASKDEIGQLATNFNQMSKELYRIDRGRTQFIGDVSHELKTPLASMKALIDSLLYGEDDLEVYREYLGDMDSEIDRLTRLIKSLLQLTKIEETGVELKECRLDELMGDVVKILKPLLEQEEVTIVKDLNPPIQVICDGERMKEVFINLVDNAIKYKDPNKGVNQVWITGKLEKNQYIISIKDNGIGISKEDIELIFEKFYRTDLSRSRDTGGAGIGLSIVDRILKAHQWGIRVKSEKGEGTCFEVVIPKYSIKSTC